MEVCEQLLTCAFSRRYEQSHNRLCRGFIDCYCRGPLQQRCARKGHMLQRGAQPDVRMMPSGEMIE